MMDIFIMVFRFRESLKVNWLELSFIDMKKGSFEINFWAYSQTCSCAYFVLR